MGLPLLLRKEEVTDLPVSIGGGTGCVPALPPKRQLELQSIGGKTFLSSLLFGFCLPSFCSIRERFFIWPEAPVLCECWSRVAVGPKPLPLALASFASKGASRDSGFLRPPPLHFFLRELGGGLGWFGVSGLLVEGTFVTFLPPSPYPTGWFHFQGGHFGLTGYSGGYFRLPFGEPCDSLRPTLLF